MTGLHYLATHDPDHHVEIHVGRIGAIRDIATTARYAPATVADYRRRTDVHTVRVVAAGETMILPGPAAHLYAVETVTGQPLTEEAVA